MGKSKGTVLVYGLIDGMMAMVLLVRAVIAVLRRGLVWSLSWCKLLFYGEKQKPNSVFAPEVPAGGKPLIKKVRINVIVYRYVP